MPKKDYDHSPEVEQMLRDLDRALEEDQRKRAAGLEKTVEASRMTKEDDLLNKIERASREATQRKMEYPVPAQPGPQGPQTLRGQMPQQPMPQQPPPIQPVPTGPAPRPGPIAMAPSPPPAQPLPAPGPPAQPMPTPSPAPAQPMPTPAPMPGQPMAVTPEQWAMMQQQIYGMG